MGKVELAVLRLGAYELRYDDDIPDGVAINEAVEIAKKIRSGELRRIRQCDPCQDYEVR